jgi:hypothetical protein
MKTRSMTQRVLVTAGIAVVLSLAAVSPGRAQIIPCEGEDPGDVCFLVPNPDNGSTCVCVTPGENVQCGEPTSAGTLCPVPFTPETDTWNLVFGTNNAIKLGTTVPETGTCTSFVLVVQAFRITQAQYAAREDPQFGDTVCNPTADPTGTPPLVPPSTDCVFYRLHGESVSSSCYPDTPTAWDYSILWNIPAIQGNKHDWMLLRARCSESLEDPSPFCDGTQLFSENVTVMVEKKPPVGTDPVVRGTGDGISDFIVAISTRHPHRIPPLIIP